jgi:hypothetical protein
MNLSEIINQFKIYRKYALGFNVIGGIIVLHCIFFRESVDQNIYFLMFSLTFAASIIIFLYIFFFYNKKKMNLLLNFIAMMISIWFSSVVLYIYYSGCLMILNKN